MRAARLNKIGEPLRIEERPAPTPRPGGVVVAVLAAHMRMIAAGMLDVRKIETHVFALEDINAAIAKAPTFRGLSACIIVP
jgi:threonine dehydrogenase-like Zn-dependent dehydrogenase